MMRRLFLLCGLVGLLSGIMGCSETLPDARKIETAVEIYPDYKDVTFPTSVAPPNFKLLAPHTEAYARISGGGTELIVKEKGGFFSIPEKKWAGLLEGAKGDDIEITVYANDNGWIQYPAFKQYVSEDPMDPYVAYRLIDPAYEMWNRMGIYQRELATYRQTPIMENRMVGENCMNCHSFCMQDPERMLFHMRDKYAGTYLLNKGKIEKLNTKTDQTMSALVYPSWHPSGKFVAFSVNITALSVQLNDPNRVEVFDSASDVVVYDVERHQVISNSTLMSEGAFETFPSFTADGKSLLFCTAKAQNMPFDYDKVKYDLCSVSFDPESRTLGSTVDTLYQASALDKSVSFPRVSPDGRFLMFTVASYGNFSIWHKDADLYLMDLLTGETKPLSGANSDDVESYHSWSSNGKWFVFGSRREDGLYARLYVAHLDERGNASKPFLLPQEDPDFYHSFMLSYSIPEFVKGEVKDRMRELAIIARDDPGIQLTFRE